MTIKILACPFPFVKHNHLPTPGCSRERVSYPSFFSDCAFRLCYSGHLHGDSQKLPPHLLATLEIPEDPILTRAIFVSMISIKGCLYRQVAIPADA
jgi:hypothetical protein